MKDNTEYNGNSIINSCGYKIERKEELKNGFTIIYITKKGE